jgi:rubredoxin-NAD+ reductase
MLSPPLFTRKKIKPIIILGFGLAGYTAAREFRKLDKTTSLTIVMADDGSFYSKSDSGH